MEYISETRLLFESNRQASMVAACMSVDEELQPDKISKSFVVDERYLVM